MSTLTNYCTLSSCNGGAGGCTSDGMMRLPVDQDAGRSISSEWLQLLRRRGPTIPPLRHASSLLLVGRVTQSGGFFVHLAMGRQSRSWTGTVLPEPGPCC